MITPGVLCVHLAYDHAPPSTINQGREKYGDAYMSMKDLWATHTLLASDSSKEHKLLTGGADVTKIREKAQKYWRKTQSYQKPIDNSGRTDFNGLL